MRSFFRYLRNYKFHYIPLVEISIFKENLLYNLDIFRKIFGHSGVAPVLKSNAYGHGLVQIAKILDKEKLPFFVIDSFHEALILRNEKIKTPLLVIGFTRIENILQNRFNNVSFTVTSLGQLKQLSQKIKLKVVLHLKIDTGMGRQGICMSEFDTAVELIKNNKNIFIQGLASHFADADNLNEVYTNEQIHKWNLVVEKIKNIFPSIIHFHLSNTAGYFYHGSSTSNIARVGIGLYGIRANSKRDQNMGLKPVLEMKSIISGIKDYERGEKIGYNGTFEIKDKSKIALLPLGYTEGIDRRLSNKGYVKIKNQFCPIVGRVCMNITTIDVSKIKDIKMEDQVIIISRETKDKNSVENIAKTCDTITHEILVQLPAQIRRTVIE